MISPQDSVGVQVADTLPQTFHEACVPKDTLAAVDLREWMAYRSLTLQGRMTGWQ